MKGWSEMYTTSFASEFVTKKTREELKFMRFWWAQDSALHLLCPSDTCASALPILGKATRIEQFPCVVTNDKA